MVHPRLSPGLLLDRLDSHIGWLRRRPDVRIIQIVRRDSMEWVKSRYLAQKTGRFMDKRYPDDLRIMVPVDRALRAIKAKRWVDQRLAGLAGSNPYVRIYYEDFLEDNRDVLERCLEFLDVDLKKLPVDGEFLSRQSTGSADKYLKNYDELRGALENQDLLAAEPAA